jgi:hypothetical protein
MRQGPQEVVKYRHLSSYLPLMYLSNRSEMHYLKDVDSIQVEDDSLSDEFVLSVRRLFPNLTYVEFYSCCNSPIISNPYGYCTIISVTSITFKSNIPSAHGLKRILCIFSNLKSITSHSYKHRRHNRLRQESDLVGGRERLENFAGYQCGSKKMSKKKVLSLSINHCCLFLIFLPFSFDCYERSQTIISKCKNHLISNFMCVCVIEID